jgi:mono/diheme cytochrome c family protein
MRNAFTIPSVFIALLAAGAIMTGGGGCAGGRTFLPAAEELAAGGALSSGVDALRRGRSVYVTECAACHRLFGPAEYSPEQWRGIVRRMAIRASIGDDQAGDLLAYLSSASRAANLESMKNR